MKESLSLSSSPANLRISFVWRLPIKCESKKARESVCFVGPLSLNVTTQRLGSHIDTEYKLSPGTGFCHGRLVASGGQPLDQFRNVKHAVPMLSIESLRNEDEARDFAAKVHRFLGIEEGVEHCDMRQTFSDEFERRVIGFFDTARSN